MIDATEFSMPTMDIKLGFHQVAKFNYFPGWHQQVSVSELLMNKKAYDALPKSYKKMLQMAAGHQVLYNYAESEAANPAAMAELTQKYGVQVKRWPDDQTRGVREGLAGGDQGGVGQGSAVQEDRRRLPRVPQEVRDLGRRAVAQAYLPDSEASTSSRIARGRAPRSALWTPCSVWVAGSRTAIALAVGVAAGARPGLRLRYRALDPEQRGRAPLQGRSSSCRS